jgi:hypothetical protein
MVNIQTRKDLTKYLQSCIENIPDEEKYMLDDNEELPYNSIKSYIIESNRKEFNNILLKKFDVKIGRTKDPTLKLISVIDKEKNKKTRFFGDLLDKRFFVLYSRFLRISFC